MFIEVEEVLANILQLIIEIISRFIRQNSYSVYKSRKYKDNSIVLYTKAVLDSAINKKFLYLLYKMLLTQNQYIKKFYSKKVTFKSSIN